MVFEELEKKLENNGYEICQYRNIPYGRQVKITNGATITCFDNGNIQVQGKAKVKIEIEEILGRINKITK